MAAIASLYAVLWLGRLHPDEVFQFLEPAYWRVHGYGILAWEWHAGVRNWGVPLFFAGLLELCDRAGVDNPRLYRAVVELPQYLLHAWMLLSVYRYTQRRVGDGWAWLSVLAVGLNGVVVAFAGRTLGESLSAAFFVIGVELLDRDERPVKSGLLGGLTLGLSVVARYGSAVLVLAALVWLLGRRAWRKLLFTCLAGAAVAGALGVLDFFTWHRAFHSFLTYFDFNVASGHAAEEFGRSPAWFYLPWLGVVPLWAWPGMGFALRTQRPRVPLPLLAAVLYVVAISITAHKEARFLYPALVLFSMAGIAGVAAWIARLKPNVGRSLAAATVLSSVAVAFVPGDLQVQRPDQFRAIAAAGRDPKLTGLMVVDEGVWGTGGFFYIGKNVPWLPTGSTDRDPTLRFGLQDPRMNRAVTYDDAGMSLLEAGGFKVVGRLGRAAVLAR